MNLSCCRDQARTFDLAKFSRTASFNDLPVLRAGDTVYIPNKDQSIWARLRVGLNDLFQVTALAVLLGVI